MGLKGNTLFLVTVFAGCPASFLVAGVMGGLLGWVFSLPLPLERDPGAGFADGGVLHIDSPPRRHNNPQ